MLDEEQRGTTAQRPPLASMEQRHKDRLRELTSFFQSQLQCNATLIGKLCSLRLLEEEEEEEVRARAVTNISIARIRCFIELQQFQIEAEKTSAPKIKLLLRIVAKKGPQAYEKFHSALRECHQEHVAEKLETDNGGQRLLPGSNDRAAPRVLQVRYLTTSRATTPMAVASEQQQQQA